jgi:Fe(3+) dicitrate transport protein
VEFLGSYDPLEGQAIGLPLFVSATYTNATLTNALSAGGGDDILAGGEPGARLPYVPEWKLAAGIGLEAEKWGVDLSATYVSETYGTARNVDSPVDSAREGRIDGGITVDLAAHIQVSEKVKLIAGVHNLFDETLLVSRIPEGPRAGAPRQVFVGFELLW